jgi:peptidoglycan/LPS O-acetylase OafA/YrhL
MPVTGNTEHTHPENRAFFPALDGLRAVAFLMVFLQHYVGLPWGWTGVNVFFVLSGFLITGILFDTRDDPHRARNFYVRRTLRIFPLYYGIFLLLLLLHPILHWRWSLEWLAWPLYVGNFLRFTSPAAAIRDTPQQIAGDAHLLSARLPHLEGNLGHFWSLCVEEQFYLFWPWIVFWLRRRWLLWVCGIAVVVVPLLRVAANAHAPQWMLDRELLYRATPFQLDALLLGGLVALLWRGPHRERLLLTGRVVAWAGLLAVAIYMAFTLHPTSTEAFRLYQYPQWRLTWGLTLVNVLSAALIIACLRPGNWIHRAMTVPAMRWVGRISYGAYVFHDMLHNVYTRMIVHSSLRIPAPFLIRHLDISTAALGLTCTLLLSWLSFRFFESRFLNMKERFTRRA